jgi:hypothetical protein
MSSNEQPPSRHLRRFRAVGPGMTSYENHRITMAGKVLRASAQKTGAKEQCKAQKLAGVDTWATTITGVRLGGAV